MKIINLAFLSAAFLTAFNAYTTDIRTQDWTEERKLTFTQFANIVKENHPGSNLAVHCDDVVSHQFSGNWINCDDAVGTAAIISRQTQTAGELANALIEDTGMHYMFGGSR